RLIPRLGMLGIVREVAASSSLRVLVRTVTPFAPMLDRLACPQAALISPNARLDGEAPGSGPFQLAQKGETGLELVRARDDGRDTIDCLQFKTFPHGSAMWDALLSGDIDLAYECPYEHVRKRSSFPVVSFSPSLSVNMLIMNTRSRACCDVAVRRAARAAI